MNNAIEYVAPKNKTMAHITSLNNRILCIVGIPIFVFKKYGQISFNLMELNMIPTFKQLLQSEIDNAKKNRSYYKQYDVKIMRAFYKKAMTKHKIYENILARRSGMDYSAGMRFKKSISNMDQSKEPTKNNKLGKKN